MKKNLLVLFSILITISLSAQVKIKGATIGSPYYGKKSYSTTIAGVKGKIIFDTNHKHILYGVVFSAENKNEDSDIDPVFFAKAVVSHYKLNSSVKLGKERSIFIDVDKNDIHFQIDIGKPLSEWNNPGSSAINISLWIYSNQLLKKWKKNERKRKLNDF